MSKRILSMILAFCCVLALLPVTAPRASAAELPMQQVSVPTKVNPLYVDVLDVSDFIDELKALKRQDNYGTMGTMSTEPTYEHPNTARNQIREFLKARNSSFTVYYYAPYSPEITDCQAYVGETAIVLLAAAMDHTGNPTEGDYLLWQWGTYDCDGMYGVDEENSLVFVQITYTMTYYTTAEQEAEMDTAVVKLLEDLDLEEADTYAKIKKVYDYICSNVTYDDANLEDDSYKLKFTFKTDAGILNYLNHKEFTVSDITFQQKKS